MFIQCGIDFLYLLLYVKSYTFRETETILK